jgi:hypothetical protein
VSQSVADQREASQDQKEPEKRAQDGDKETRNHGPLDEPIAQEIDQFHALFMPVTNEMLGQTSKEMRHIRGAAEFFKGPVKEHPFIKTEYFGRVFTNAPDVMGHEDNRGLSLLIEIL